MDVLRAALGETEMLYFGASYGTKLGATYADVFPDKVGRMVLDGAVDLVHRLLGSSASSRPAASRSALRSYVQNCVDEGDCFLGDTLDDGPATDPGPHRRTSTRSRSRPSSATGADRGATPFYGIVAPLYSRDTGSILDQGLQDAFDGDGTILLLLALGLLRVARRRTAPTTTTALEAILAINCLDDPDFVTADEVPAQIPAFEEASPTFGDVFAWGLTDCPASRRTVHRDAAAPDAARAPRRSWWSARRATRRRRTSGPCTWPTSSSRRCWSAATATATPATTPATTASTRRSRTTSSTAPCPQDGLEC